MTDPAPSLKISEVFASVQGEGPSVGRPSTFVRLGLCNLRCTWCDTPYTWDWDRFDRSAEVTARDVAALAEEVRALAPRNVVLTGGEPLMQQPGLVALIDALGPGFRVEVETAGTLIPSPQLVDRIHQFNVSPKLAHSGNPEKRRLVPAALEAFAQLPSASFKLVVTGPEDHAEIDALLARYGIAPDRVWLMPEATDATTLIARSRDLADHCVARGFHLGTRLQVLLWGDTRGT